MAHRDPRRLVAMLALTVTFLALSNGAYAERAPGTEHPWNFGASLGWKDYEGDEPVDDSIYGALHVGYDYTPTWTFEGTLNYIPTIEDNRGLLILHGGVNDTSALGVTLEALWHFTRWERVDPYFAGGAGFLFYADDFEDDGRDYLLLGGGGVMYHFNDEWGVRADGRFMMAGNDTEFNTRVSGGVTWCPGGHIGEEIVVGGPVDSDGDGLSDDEEATLGTDPHNPDTDNDGLSDYLEVKEHGTDPFKADSDMDMLKDGEEVHSYKTSPVMADTDQGGVSDGHEVLEDGTDPLNAADDLQLYTLNIEFDSKQWVVKQQYHSQLDAIGKVLKRLPESTASIEGHADKRKTSSAAYNKKLSQRRAEAVMAYFGKEWGVAASRMTATGYGFSRPIAENDPRAGNPQNRRVEVYVDEAGGGSSRIDSDVMDVPVTAPVVVVPEKGVK